MAKADIKIKGRSYSVACAPGQEERLVALSRRLQLRVFRQLGRSRLGPGHVERESSRRDEEDEASGKKRRPEQSILKR